MALDSALDVAGYDLKEEPELVPLGRASQFPIELRLILSIAPPTEADMLGFRSRALQMADILGTGFAGAVTVADAHWYYSDTTHPRFGGIVGHRSYRVR